jgi:NAD(P)H-dependent FMN reductase
MNIVILSSSIRKGRKSHRAALYLNNYINENTDANAEIFDLLEADFPLFHERLQFLENPPEIAVKYSEVIDNADAIIVVSPEYNGGYPASFKNAFDLLYSQWLGKPIGLVSASSGRFGGSQVIQKLQLLYTKLGALVMGPGVSVAFIDKVFDENGEINDEQVETAIGKYVSQIIANINS